MHPTPFESSHYLESFDCGGEALNSYLKKTALLSQNSHTSKTYITLNKTREVCGFYTLTFGSISQEVSSKRVSHGTGHHPIPVLILARLAVDNNHKKRGLGAGLLKDAFKRCLNACDIAGIRAFVVHAKDDNAKSFYMKYGFEESPLDPYHLMILIKDIKKSLNISVD